MEEKKVTTSEPRKESINIEELPGLKPKDIDHDKKGEWNEKYMNLSYEKKILFETQEQTRLIRRISNNVLFYFWVTIISGVLTLILLLIGRL